MTGIRPKNTKIKNFLLFLASIERKMDIILSSFQIVFRSRVNDKKKPKL